MRPRPLVGEVEWFFTAGTVGLAAAVGVIRGRRGVFVTRDTDYVPRSRRRATTSLGHGA